MTSRPARDGVETITECGPDPDQSATASLVRALRGQSQPHDRRPRHYWLSVPPRWQCLSALAIGVWWWLPAGNDGTSAAEPCRAPHRRAPEWAPVALSQSPATAVSTADGRLLFRVRDARWRRHDDIWQLTLQTSMQNDTPGDNYHSDWRYDALVVGQRPWPVKCFSAPRELVEPGHIQDATVGFDVGCEPVGIELDLQEGRINLTDPALEPGPCLSA